MKKTAHIFTVGECWCSTIDEIRKHCEIERNELSTLFQFDHLQCGREDKFTPKQDSLKSVRDVLIKWQRLTDKYNLIYTLFTDNHDNSFFISRVGNDKELRYESATCIATMFYMLKGIPFIYQGQEFGTTAPTYPTINNFDDIESLNAYKTFLLDNPPDVALSRVNFGSRDNARHPVAWNNSENGGFSTNTPWIKPHSRYKEINLETDLHSQKSVFGFYKNLLHLRANSDAVILGELEVLSNPSDNYFIFTRTYKNQKIGVVCNFDTANTVTLPFTPKKLLLSNYPKTTLTTTSYLPYQTAIFEI